MIIIEAVLCSANRLNEALATSISRCSDPTANKILLLCRSSSMLRLCSGQMHLFRSGHCLTEELLVLDSIALLVALLFCRGDARQERRRDEGSNVVITRD